MQDPDQPDDPRRTRSGAPRRPVRHRARPGGSARAVPPRGENGGNGENAGSESRAPRPTRPLPRPPAAGAGREEPVVPAAASRNELAGATAARSGQRHHARESGSARPLSGTGQDGLAAPEPSSRPADPRGGPMGPPPRRRRPAPRGPLSSIPRPLRAGAAVMVLLLVVTGAWFTGLAFWANGRIEHVDALSGRDRTPGTTYLVAGSDRRGGDAVADDGTQGARADTLMLLHRAPNGKRYLVSLPRDTLVDIPGHGKMKLNAAYAIGGPKLLVQTVEGFTGMTIDHFVEIGFDGVSGLVDAVGTVNLCIDRDVDDEKSGLKMTKGCHDVGGDQALAFVRARYFDPTADIGRQQRQQQFVAALMKKVMTPGVLLNPIAQARLAGAGTEALRTDTRTGVIDLGRMALTMRGAMKDGSSLSMPYTDENYRTKHSGVAILTDDEEIARFFGSIEDGSAKAPS